MAGVDEGLIAVDPDKISEYLAYLDGRAASNEADAISGLEAMGVDVPALMLKRYEHSRRWSDRASSVHHCTRYASLSPAAFELGVIALRDRSRLVRSRACMLLTFTQNPKAIEPLRELLDDAALRDEAAAAIDILERIQRI